MDLNGNVLIKKRKMRKNSLVFFIEYLSKIKVIKYSWKSKVLTRKREEVFFGYELILILTRKCLFWELIVNYWKYIHEELAWWF